MDSAVAAEVRSPTNIAYCPLLRARVLKAAVEAAVDSSRGTQVPQTQFSVCPRPFCVFYTPTHGARRDGLVHARS